MRIIRVRGRPSRSKAISMPILRRKVTSLGRPLEALDHRIKQDAEDARTLCLERGPEVPMLCDSRPYDLLTEPLDPSQSAFLVPAHEP
jgi:hypothetical protein